MNIIIERSSVANDANGKPFAAEELLGLCRVSVTHDSIKITPGDKREKALLDLAKPPLRGSWRQDGRDLWILSLAGESARLCVRPQRVEERGPLENLVPLDQVKMFTTEMEDEVLVVYVADDQAEAKVEDSPLEAERRRLGAMTNESLQKIAAKRGVEWDSKASKATMIQRLAEKAA